MFGFQNEYAAIPEGMQRALLRYTMDHVPAGGFLEAVVSNDLRNAFGRADSVNAPLIGLYVLWFMNEAPPGCHGSPEKYAEWSQKQA